jgi:sucrose-6F-phosphate phosphohydrolase
VGRHQLLVTDLDGTLLGDDGALGRFTDWYRADGQDRRLVYATGRTVESVVDLIDTGALPGPDAIVSSVGTEIHHPAGSGWPGWPPVDDRWDPHRVRTAMARIPGIEPQPDEAQSTWKSSFHAVDLSEVALDEIRGRLHRADLAGTIVYSSGRDLDILPAWAGKARAAQFLVDAWRLTVDEVVVSGDSGNDLDLLTSGPHAVVVGNAQPELLGLRGPRVYRAVQAYADGILEGIRYWEGLKCPRHAL